MAHTDVHFLHPLGYETYPEEERLQLTTLDYPSICTWMNYALFFELKDDRQRPVLVEALKLGLERTLAQCKQLVGKIEKHDNNLFYVKKRETTVKFVVKVFDSDFPSFPHIEQAHFASSKLGDFNQLSVDDMTYGQKPESSPEASPTIAAFQANFIPGGLILNTQYHHYANDVSGWASFVHQLAENCYLIINKTPPPAWEPSCVDLPRFRARDVPEESKVDGPPVASRHPLLHKNWSLVLLHLPKHKAAALKSLAMPDDGSRISTYDAFSAMIWRVITRHRAAFYHADLDSPPLWGETIDMRRRLDPPVPKRVQRNIIYAALSVFQPHQLTAREVISEAPLSRLALYVRSLTNTATNEALDHFIEAHEPIRDKSCLRVRIDSMPPLTIAMTDWRHADVCNADFGFGKARAFRQLYSTLTEGMVVVYPPRPSGNPNEGYEFAIPVETPLLESILEDAEMKEYFEFRGFEVKGS